MSAAATAFAESGHGILAGMSTRPRSQAGEPMTLGNMRANGVRSLDVSCWQCHHRAILSAHPWPDHVPVPSFGPRMVCRRADQATVAGRGTSGRIPWARVDSASLAFAPCLPQWHWKEDEAVDLDGVGQSGGDA
jgi:hypothetical protein